MLRIVKYPHPALRHQSKPLRRVDGDLKKVVREMFDLMYQQNGIGLAANQVNLPYRMFILNTEGDPTKGQEHVFLNPVIGKRSGTVEAEEGCLSFPEIYAPVKRSEKIVISAYNLDGVEINLPLTGLFARAPNTNTTTSTACCSSTASRPAAAVDQAGAERPGTAIRGRPSARRDSRRPANRHTTGRVGTVANVG